jgi:predicted RNA methylase
MLYTMQTVYGDLTGKHIGDLGCGSGMLSIGAAMFDCG